MKHFGDDRDDLLREGIRVGASQEVSIDLFSHLTEHLRRKECFSAVPKEERLNATYEELPATIPGS
jgi:hypothetical protein